MKHNHNHDNAPDADALIPVKFEFTHPTAKSVSIAGTFNNWQPEKKTLHAKEPGKWYKDTELKAGTYEYRFIVDGEWVPDPKAKEQVGNPFGGTNSVIRVSKSK